METDLSSCHENSSDVIFVMDLVPRAKGLHGGSNGTLNVLCPLLGTGTTPSLAIALCSLVLP